MSGTSWAGTSTRAHVLAPVQAVLKPQRKELDSIRDTEFRTEFLYDDAGVPIRLSGQDPEKREDVLRLLVHKLARPGRDGSAARCRGNSRGSRTSAVGGRCCSWAATGRPR